MLIYTSSWQARLPDNFARIGISRGAPRGTAAGYRMYRTLAPGPWFKTADVRQYRGLYMEQLGKLKASDVLAELAKMADGKTPCLLCFEKGSATKEWCHRGYISVWLETELGLQVREYGYEAIGFGWTHPKIPPEFRTVMA